MTDEKDKPIKYEVKIVFPNRESFGDFNMQVRGQDSMEPETTRRVYEFVKDLVGDEDRSDGYHARITFLIEEIR